jgi:putative endonuclease
MGLNRKQIARETEEYAAQFLLTRNYRIADRNVRPFPGMARGEIDIVAWDGDTLCIVEVKARRTLRIDAEVSITATKRKQLIRLTEMYLARHRIRDCEIRFDVVSVYYGAHLPSPLLTLHKNAFDTW